MSLSVHVDDVAQEFSGSAEESFTSLSSAGEALVQGFQARGLTISGKSVAIGTNPKITRALARHFKKLGIDLATEDIAPHLGYARTFKPKLGFSVLRQRFAKAKVRASRISRIARASPKTAGLFKAGVSPQATYGSNLIGLSKSLSLALDRMALQCVGRLGFNPDRNSSLWIQYQGIPSVQAMVKFMVCWLCWWETLPASQKARVQRSWLFYLPRLQKLDHKGRQQMVRCPLTALQNYLLGMQCEIPDPNFWKWPTSDWITVEGSAAQVLEQCEQSAMSLKWELSATNSYLGEGMGTRPNFDEALSAVKKLQKEGWRRKAQLLRCAIAGGAGVGERLRINRLCTRCELGVVETAQHRYYECPANDKIEEPVAAEWIKKSKWTVQVAKRDLMLPKCLFGRAILPEAMSYGLCKWNEGFNYQHATASCSAQAFSDGSGGDSRQQVPKWAQRVGAAGVSFDISKDGTQLTNVSLAASSIPGRQTVPRAEILGATMSYCLSSNDVSSDCKYVVDTVQEIEAMCEEEVAHSKALRGKNYDLWLAWWQERQQQGYRSIKKVKAHMELSEVTSGAISWHDWLGNAIADALAGAAAWLAADDSVVRANLARNAAMVYSIAMRIAFIEMDAAKHKEARTSWQFLEAEDKLSMQAASTMIDQRIREMGHDLRSCSRGKLRCLKCSIVKPLSKSSFWWNVKCGGFSAEKSDLVFEGALERKMPRDMHGHNLLPCGARWICTACGAIGSLGDLPRECSDTGAQSRTRNVKEMQVNFEAWLAVSRLESDTQTRRARDNKRRLRAASSSWIANLESIEGETPQGEEAGPAPAWISRVDPSHTQLFHGGGLVYCNRCSCVASSVGGNSRLWKTCSGATVAGSLGRRKRLREGWHPHANQYEVASWPDGRPVSQRVAFKSYRLVQQASAGASPQFRLLQQRNFTEPEIQDATPSHDETLRVAEILDRLLDEYAADRDAEVPTFAEIMTVGPVARVSGRQVAECIQVV